MHKTVTQEMNSGQRLRATHEFRPVDHLYRTEFYIWEEAIEKWKSQGLPEDWAERNLFNYDPPGIVETGLYLGWVEPPFLPEFEEKTVEVRDDHEIIQDRAGRLLKVFRGRRHGFMPEYIKHAVSGLADWEEIASRLDPNDHERWAGLPEMVRDRRAQANSLEGLLQQRFIGGYMYLRALMGPEDLLYKFYDDPDLIHACMRGWFDIVDAGVARVQAEVEIDEIYIGEDICYNHGLLISPDAVREFLFPYYQQVLSNARSRQKRKIYLHIDTDGDCRPAIPLYLELGMDKMSPFEVASGCDVVEIAKQYPGLIMAGGIDKRVLADGKEAIEAHLRHIIPFMVERGGFYPTCDHGVPDDVSFEDYMFYRQRMCEMDHR